MTAFAQAEALADVWRALTTEEAAIVDGLLEEASNKLRVACLERGVNIDDALEAEIAAQKSFKSELAATAVVNAVRRRLGNPDGYLEEAIDDFRGRRDAATSTGEIYIAPADLKGLVPNRRGGFRTIRLRAAL